MSKVLVPGKEGSSQPLSQSGVGRASGGASHLFASSTSLRVTGRFLRQQLWAWPIIAAVLLGISGWWVSRVIESAMRQQRAADLNAMVDASVTSLRSWLHEQKINVQLIAADEPLRPLIAELVHAAQGDKPAAERQLLQSPAQESLQRQMSPLLKTADYIGYFVVAPDATIVASDQTTAIGKPLLGVQKDFFQQVLQGHPLVSRPFLSRLLLPNDNGELTANLPTMFTAAPIPGADGKPLAVLGLRICPRRVFTKVLQSVRFGESGETYAFDRNGLMLSESRFDDDLKQVGLLVDQPDARSILAIELRDPGVDLMQGARPKGRRVDQPLTQIVAEAVQGKDGFNADGYRDYRGVQCVGAWRWLDDYGFGVATEVDAAEAFQPVRMLRHAFWAMMALLGLASIGIFVAMLFIARQQRALQRATVAAKKLGQYALEEKLGSGGMGTVYKARHAMLRRPTAVKLLDVERMSDMTVARFEREVQMTSTLTHPNTIVVFDYGRTPEGVFYYAMEYLDGMNLDTLVRRFGPQPEARVVCLLGQICAALAEAHAAGMIHRDIKPANIFLTMRGGLYDFVKVLDFGLVKSLDGEDEANLTNPNALTGTPLYASPEAIAHPDQVDARTDIYAVAAVGYYLLTGTPVFTGNSIVEICLKHQTADPERPSVRLGKPISPDLENLLLQCLAKSPADRPSNASQLYACLEACTVEGNWSPRDAAVWWAEHDGSASADQQVLAATMEYPIRRQYSVDTTVAFDGDTKEAPSTKKNESTGGLR